MPPGLSREGWVLRKMLSDKKHSVYTAHFLAINSIKNERFCILFALFKLFAQRRAASQPGTHHNLYLISLTVQKVEIKNLQTFAVSL